jgi:hypothetical protein
VTACRNILHQHQSPKPREDRRAGDAVLHGPKRYRGASYDYEFGRHYREVFCGRAELDDTPCFRCECGAEIDCNDDRCRRCGSTEPGEWR